MKHDAIVSQGIQIHERVEIPNELLPADSMVEIQAKIAAGYYTKGEKVTDEADEAVQGRGWADDEVVKTVPLSWDDVNVSPPSGIFVRLLTKLTALSFCSSTKVGL